MADEQPVRDGLEDMSDLRALTALRDLDRRLSSQRIHLFITRWLYLPLMLVALIAMVLGLILGSGTPGPVIGGIVMTAGAAAAFFTWARRQEDDLADLEDERDGLLRDHPSIQAHDRRRVPLQSTPGGARGRRDG